MNPLVTSKSSRIRPRPRIIRSLAAALLLILTATNLASGTDDFQFVPFDRAFDSAWSLDRLWDDGLAEVAIYNAERVIYSRPRPHEEVRILVAEPMRADTHVKADPPYEGEPLLPVLKVNVFSRVETKNYPYHLMASLFFDRAAPARVVKASYTSQEWCGMTFKELQLYDTPPRFTANSYWDGEAIVDEALDWPADALLADQLPVTLRSCRLKEGQSMDFTLIDSQVGSRATVPRAGLSCRLVRLSATENLTVADEKYAPDRQIVYSVRRANGAGSGASGAAELARLVFSAEPPHVLLDYAFESGLRGTLKSVTRRPYWRD